jgi:antitoxin HigA-1
MRKLSITSITTKGHFMHKPAHPGEILKEDIIGPLRLNMETTANHLGISRKHLSRLCNGKATLSAEVAVKLEQAFGAPTAETWMKLQAQYSVWEVKQSCENPIEPIRAA